MAEEKWHDVGSAEDLRKRPVTPVRAGTIPIALVHRDGAWSAISGVCNHAGGPLGEGRLDGDYVVCPWHYWKFHQRTGEGEPGFEDDRVPSYAVQGRGRPRPASTPTPRTPRAQEAAPAAPARAAGARASPARSAWSASRPPRWTARTRATRPPTRCSTHAVAHARRGARRRDAADPARRAAASAPARATTRRAPRPAPGPARSRRWTRTTSWTGLRGARALGRRDPGRDADPLGRGELALLQDGRAHELHPEPDHDPQPRADPQQGRGLHHHRRPGQRAGGGRPDAGLLRRARAASSRSSPSSPTRAAGRRRTWRRTWTCCARASELRDGARRWSSAAPSWPDA